MDYKDKDRWKAALPGVPYPAGGMFDQAYYAFGMPVSPTDVGNLNAAVFGKALGIPERILMQQAGAAHLRDNLGYSFWASQKASFTKKHYGDSKRCNKYIKLGFSIYPF